MKERKSKPFTLGQFFNEADKKLLENSNKNSYRKPRNSHTPFFVQTPLATLNPSQPLPISLEKITQQSELSGYFYTKIKTVYPTRPIFLTGSALAEALLGYSEKFKPNDFDYVMVGVSLDKIMKILSKDDSVRCTLQCNSENKESLLVEKLAKDGSVIESIDIIHIPCNHKTIFEPLLKKLLAENAAERDWTLYSLFLNLDDNILYHGEGWLKHIKDRELAPTLSIENSLGADPIRIIRGLRAIYKFNLQGTSQEVKNHLASNGNGMYLCPPFRIAASLNKLLKDCGIENGLKLLHEYNLLSESNGCFYFITLPWRGIQKINMPPSSSYPRMNLAEKREQFTFNDDEIISAFINKNCNALKNILMSRIISDKQQIADKSMFQYVVDNNMPEFLSLLLLNGMPLPKDFFYPKIATEPEQATANWAQVVKNSQ